MTELLHIIIHLYFCFSYPQISVQTSPKSSPGFLFGTILGPRVLVCILPRGKKRPQEKFTLTLYKDEGGDENGQRYNQYKRNIIKIIKSPQSTQALA